MKNNNALKYVLITPARNEEIFIEKTIQSVISQTVLPERWVIVSDGSTDRTDEIVGRYLPENRWIELVRLPERRDRQFAAKVACFNAGYEKLRDIEYDTIGNLDADISFGQNYYENILSKFSQNSKLGIAGGNRYDIYDGKTVEMFRSLDSVMGAIQLFRRQCFEDVGGYIPLELGGIDAVAETMARMHGWQVRTFHEIKVYHNRRTGTANSSVLKARFREGKRDYLIGYHPAFEVFRCLNRAADIPYVIGSICMLMGYIGSFFWNAKRQVPDEFVAYLRSEQMFKIRALFMLQKRLKY